MPTITYISADGSKTTVEAEDGVSLMQTAIAHGIDGIVGECGGSAICATCHIYVEGTFSDRLPPRSEVEDEMLDCTVSERRYNSRLACQIKAYAEVEGIVVHLPEHQQ